MKNEHGFTLLELLVTLAVAGVLFTVAFPSFQTTMANNRQVAAINELLGALLYARSEAISENKATSVCASSDQQTCGTDWAQGWIVFVGSVPAASTITPLRVHTALNSSETLNSSLGSSITFSGNGTSNVSGDFRLCDSRGGSYARSLNVTSTGIARASQTAGTYLNGTSVSCP